MAADDSYNSNMNDAMVRHADDVGQAEGQQAVLLGQAETAFATSEGAIEQQLYTSLGSAADGLAGTLATNDETFTSTVAQASAAAAENLAGDEQTWTQAVDPAEVAYIQTEGADEVADAQAIATAQAAYAYADAELPLGEGDLPSPLPAGEAGNAGSPGADFAAAYQQAYAAWITDLTSSFISDAKAVAQADAQDQLDLAQAAENADLAQAAANVAFVNQDAPAAASEAVELETADDNYSLSVVQHLDAEANAQATADATWMAGIAAADAKYLLGTAVADMTFNAGGTGLWHDSKLVADSRLVTAQAWRDLTQGYADAALARIGAEAVAGKQFSQQDAVSWQTMIGGEASAIDGFAHADDAAAAAESDALADASGQLIQAVAQADANESTADASAADGFATDEANQTRGAWQSLVNWASPNSYNAAGQPGLAWLGFEAQQAQYLAQWQATATSDDAQYVSQITQQEIDYANRDAAAFTAEAHSIDAADQQAADTAADADQALTNGLAGDELAYENSAAAAVANWQTAAAQAAHDNAVALAQADDDFANGLDWADYQAEQAAAGTAFSSAQTAAYNAYTEQLGAADAAQVSSDAGVTLTHARQIADAVQTDAVAADKAIDVYNRAESDAYDQEQKNDAQSLWSRDNSDAIAYFNALDNINQSTPWGAQAVAQAQAEMTRAVTLAQAALTLSDAVADAQDGQEDIQWDLQQSQSDALAQLAHDQAYSDAQANDDAGLAQSAATAALAAADAYFADLPPSPGDDGLPLNENWLQAGLLSIAPPASSADYSYLDNIDDVSVDGKMGWAWSVGPTTQPFGQTWTDPQTNWALAFDTPYAPPNPWAGYFNWRSPGTPPPSPPTFNGDWATDPPPVPEIRTIIHQDPTDPELATKTSDASTARQPGAAPGDGTKPPAGEFSAVANGPSIGADPTPWYARWWKNTKRLWQNDPASQYEQRVNGRTLLITPVERMSSQEQAAASFMHRGVKPLVNLGKNVVGAAKAVAKHGYDTPGAIHDDVEMVKNIPNTIEHLQNLKPYQRMDLGIEALYGFGILSGMGPLLRGGAGATELAGETGAMARAPLIEEAVTGETLAGDALTETAIVDEAVAESAAVDAEIIESSMSGGAASSEVAPPPPGGGLPSPEPLPPPAPEPPPPPPPPPPPETLSPPEVPAKPPSIQNPGKISSNPQNRLIETGEPLKDGTGWVRRWTRITEADELAMAKAISEHYNLVDKAADALGLSGNVKRQFMFEQMRQFRTQWRIDFLKNRSY